MKYNKQEIRIIAANCRNKRELLKAAQTFDYLISNGFMNNSRYLTDLLLTRYKELIL